MELVLTVKDYDIFIKITLISIFLGSYVTLNMILACLVKYLILNVLYAIVVVVITLRVTFKNEKTKNSSYFCFLKLIL